MKIWQYNTVPVDHARKWCIDQVKANKPESMEYELLSEFRGMTNSNAIRYKLLSENPWDVWLDTDIIIKLWWTPLKDGYIYSNFSSSIIFPNGNGEFFSKLYDYFISNNGTHQIIEQFRMENPSLFREIPDEDEKFFHLALSLGNVKAGQISNNRCILEDSGTPNMRLTWVNGIGFIN